MRLRIIHVWTEDGTEWEFFFLVLPELPPGVEIVYAAERDRAEHSPELPV